MTALRRSLRLPPRPATTASPTAAKAGRGELAADPVALALDALAAFRLTRLIVDDAIIDAPRDAIHARLDRGGPVAAKIAEGLDCYWCVGLWVAVAVAAGRSTAAWRAARYPLALSAATGILAGR